MLHQIGIALAGATFTLVMFDAIFTRNLKKCPAIGGLLHLFCNLVNLIIFVGMFISIMMMGG